MGYVENHQRKEFYKCCGSEFFLHIISNIIFVLFAGLMNGLTLGYMSMKKVDLEVLVKSGEPKHRLFALKNLTVIKRRHLLLCTLIICKAFAAEALPIFLHHLVREEITILVSTALILVFTEIIPHSVCARHGLAIGAAMAPSVRVLVWICFPVAYPISKLLDLLLTKGRKALYRRAELKMLVSLHGNEAGKGGELSCDEISIIEGALDLTEKTAGDAMTLASEIFAIDINAKLDRDLINLIINRGHSRVPVYHEQPENIIGLILVKNLLTIRAADEIPVKSMTIRSIPRVPETMSLVQLLHQFQSGLSHMAVVIRPRTNMLEQSPIRSQSKELRLEVHGESHQRRRSFTSSYTSKMVMPANDNLSPRVNSRSRRWSGESHPDILNVTDNPISPRSHEEEVVGIITMEDVMEELLKDDIFDEMDHRISGHSSFRISMDYHISGHSSFRISSDRMRHTSM